MDANAAPFVPQSLSTPERQNRRGGRRGRGRGRRRPRGQQDANEEGRSQRVEPSNQCAGAQTGGQPQSSQAATRGRGRGRGGRGRGGRGRGHRGDSAGSVDVGRGVNAVRGRQRDDMDVEESEASCQERLVAEAPPSATSRHRHRRNRPGHAPGQGPDSGRGPDTALRSRQIDEGGGDTGEGTELAKKLSELMSRGQVECCVCLELIQRDKAVWSCKTCFAIVHFSCVKKWGKRLDDDGATVDFGCPSCRAEDSNGRRPKICKCYCGRVRNPPLEPGIVPGSCGEPCLKSLGAPGSGCKHTHGGLCHPGPCPPCDRPGTPQRCRCGKESLPRMCGAPRPPEGVSCGRICGIVRPCGHVCEQECHVEGACGECTLATGVTCYCGSSSTELPCALSVTGYSCGGICSKRLDCGIHFCPSTCHEGDCPPCSLSPLVVRTCPCGKRTLSDTELAQRIACTDPVPNCQAACDRPLGCLGQHRCEQTCGHDGDCGPCTKSVEALCRCGTTVVRVPCGGSREELLSLLVCASVCNDSLTCKRHRCKRVCCGCKKRKVLVRPGVLQTESFFRAGSTTDDLHADLNDLDEADDHYEILAQRRRGHGCRAECGKPLACGKHTCDALCSHRDPCPPCGFLLHEPLSCECGAETIPPPFRCGTKPPECTKPCSKAREYCDHPCPDLCHAGACPPCVELVRKECVGQHGEGRFVLCHVGGPDGIRCHRACGRPLKCGVHACRKPCHGGFPSACETSEADGCTQVCGLPRACGHGCVAKCHPDTPCPSSVCQTEIDVRCGCGRRTEKAPCLRGGPRGLVPLGEDGFIRLRCDEECEAQRRLNAFAAAVGTNPVSLATMRKVGKQSSGFVGEDGTTTYSDFLLDFAGREYAAVALFERGLAEIVAGKCRKKSFGIVPQLYRVVLHSLAELYFLDSQSSGSAAMRSIVVCHRGAGTKPVCPIPLLSEAVARKEAEKREKNTPMARSLLIYVAPHPENRRAQVGADLDSRVRKELSAHQSGFTFVGHQPIPGRDDDHGVLVQFSTFERMDLVRNMLSGKQHVTFSSPSLGLRAPNFRREPQTRTVRDASAERAVANHASTPWADAHSGGPPVGGVASLGIGTRLSVASQNAGLQGPQGRDPSSIPDNWDD